MFIKIYGSTYCGKDLFCLNHSIAKAYCRFVTSKGTKTTTRACTKLAPDSFIVFAMYDSTPADGEWPFRAMPTEQYVEELKKK